MNTPYAVAIDHGLPIGPANETLRSALAAEQMGIVSAGYVQATPKHKLHLDSHPQRLLGICSPLATHAMLSAEPDIAALLPCDGGALERSAGHTRIVRQDPRMSALASSNAAVRTACDLASAALRRVMSRMEAHR